VLSLESDGIGCIPVLGYSHYRRPRPGLAEHVHPGCLEVSLCLRGSLVFECEGASYDLLPGNVFVSLPGERHHLFVNPKGLMMYWLFFRFGPEREAILHLPPAESRELRRALLAFPRKLFKGGERLRLAFAELFRLYDELAPGPLRSLSMRGILLALVKAAQTVPVRMENERLKSLVDEMRQHPEADYPLDLMCRRAALSAGRLNVHFKALTGLPPHAFLLGCRLRKAREQLCDTGATVTDIAVSLRFASAQHFSSQFKHLFGVAPTVLRKSLPRQS
jgi:AraC-like DNA-binding protein